MAMVTGLPQDVLILICLNIGVEGMLALMQTCRVMYSLGSLDYLWHRFLSGRDWDIPIDMPLNASLASLSSNVLREAAVKALKLDNKWRDPHLRVRRAQRIIAQNSSFVDGMRLLPGGRWLVTLQYEQTMRTDITLWSMGDLNNCRAVFKMTVLGRVRFLHAQHHHELEQITIGIASAYGTAESIRVYDFCLQDDLLTRSSLVFEATPDELYSMGRIGCMKINGEVMIVVFASMTPSWESGGQEQVVCINLVSKVATVLDCPDWSFALGRLKLFRRYFVVTTSRFTSARISFYRLPSVILDHPESPLPASQCWPKKVAIKSSLDASTAWCSDYPLVVELSDDVPTNTMEECSFTVFGHPISMQPSGARIDLLRVSFNGCKIECIPTTVPCRSIPCAGGVRLSSSGRRAVWLCPRFDTHECTLMKFALENNGSGSCISTLIPSFSGLPSNPRDFHSFVFDEISCRIAVALSSGELYILHI